MKKGTLEALNVELDEQIEFLTLLMKENRKEIKRYFDTFGDIRVRKEVTGGWDVPSNKTKDLGFLEIGRSIAKILIFKEHLRKVESEENPNDLVSIDSILGRTKKE